MWRISYQKTVLNRSQGLHLIQKRKVSGAFITAPPAASQVPRGSSFQLPRKRTGSLVNRLTPKVKPQVTQSFLPFHSMDRPLKCDHSLECHRPVLCWWFVFRKFHSFGSGIFRREKVDKLPHLKVLNMISTDTGSMRMFFIIKILMKYQQEGAPTPHFIILACGTIRGTIRDWLRASIPHV